MKQTLSGCLKSLILALLLLVNVAYGATDLSRAENYFPGGKYQLFSYPDRGSVTNVVNNIHKRVINDKAIGPIHYQHVSYNGTLTYDRRFSGHPWWDHDYGPLGATTQEIDPFNGGIGFKGGIDVIKAKITAEIYHPADAYDGEQGGGLPPPSDKGARDEYTYSVTGKVHSVDVQPLNIPKKVNDIVNRINDAYNSGAFGSFADGENRQPESGADNREDKIREDYANGQPENADNGSWEDAEVGQPKSERSIADVIWGALKELASGARDYQADGAQWGVPVGAWGDGNQYAQPDPYAPSNSAEQFGANVAAIGSMLGSRNPASLGRHADDIAGAAANAARKAEKAGDVGKNSNLGSYRPDRELPKDKYGNKIPDSEYPHTQLGTKNGRNGSYTQGREWGVDDNGKLAPKRDIDFTDHGRSDHPNPHQHTYTPNPTGGTYQRGKTEPLGD